MSLDEKLRLLRIIGQKPDWQQVRLAMVIALNTTMRGCEIKNLRWQDVDLMGRLLTIRKSKTEAGERVIPLNKSAYTAILELRELARSRGIQEGRHFVFPARQNGNIDPTTPQKSWRTAWRKVTKAVECPHCGMLQDPKDTCQNENCTADMRNIKSPTASLRFHDLRHHAITELAESQASDQTIMAIAGHVSPRMLNHYSHVWLAAKRNALDALSDSFSKASTPKTGTSEPNEDEGGYDTSRDTNPQREKGASSEVIENYGRPEWTRTIDLFRVKEAL